MVTGFPPYFSKNRNELIENIQRGKLKISSKLSVEGKELIRDVRFIQLLQRDPTKRLGYTRGAEEVKMHHFFKGIDWNSVLRKELKPPPIIRKEIHRNYIPPETLYGEQSTDVSNKVTGWTFISNF